MQLHEVIFAFQAMGGNSPLKWTEILQIPTKQSLLQYCNLLQELRLHMYDLCQQGNSSVPRPHYYQIQ